MKLNSHTTTEIPADNRKEAIESTPLAIAQIANPIEEKPPAVE